MAEYLIPSMNIPVGLHLSGEADFIRWQKDAVRQRAWELRIRRIKFRQQLTYNRLNTMVEDKLVSRQLGRWYPRLHDHVTSVVEIGHKADPVDPPRTVVTEEGEDARLTQGPEEHDEDCE